MTLKELLFMAIDKGASDIYLVGGLPVTFKISGKLQRDTEAERLLGDKLDAYKSELYEIAGRRQKDSPMQEDDFSFSIPRLARFRANVFSQRGSFAAVIRVIRFGVPDPEQMHIPEAVLKVAELSSGLVLFTGSANSGKSVSMACIIDRINQSSDKTIITMEDPIEILHSHKRSIIIQREIAMDTESFAAALRASMRQSPDVLLIGELRDSETMEVAMSAAETGQLILSSMHTLSAADTIDRIVDSFPENKQRQTRMQLARVLRCVICQKLVPSKDGSLVPAFEIMTVTPAIQNLIREGKTYQFASHIQEGGRHGMCTMNQSLLKLVKDGMIDKDVALRHSDDALQLRKRLEE